MEYLQLENSDLEVSRLGFGCCPMGGHGWGTIDFKELESAVRIAIDKGVNFFDTADIYGFGRSEAFLGNVLKGNRTKAIIATKFGARINSKGKTFFDNNPKWIDKALDNSLRRLKTDYVDLYQIHYKDELTHWGEIFEFLEQKREQGKIRYFGLSNTTFDEIENIEIPYTVLSFQNEYSLCNRSNEADILKINQAKKLSFMSWGSLGQGLLSGKYGKDAEFSKNDRRSQSIYQNFHKNFERNLNLVRAIESFSVKKNKSSTQIALRWIADKLKFSVALVGIKTVAQLIENIGAFDWYLTPEEIEYLGSI